MDPHRYLAPSGCTYDVCTRTGLAPFHGLAGAGVPGLPVHQALSLRTIKAKV